MYYGMKVKAWSRDDKVYTRYSEKVLGCSIDKEKDLVEVFSKFI